MFHSSYFADISTQITAGSSQTQEWVDNAFKSLWLKLIVDGLFYQNIAAVAAYIAVFFIGLWALNFFADWQEYGERRGSLNPLFRGILILILLGHVGGEPPVSGKLIYQLHNVVSGLVAEINNGLQSTLNEAGTGVLTSQAMVKTQAPALAGNAIRNCAVESDNDKRNACFNDASARVNDLLAPYQSYQWARDMVQRLDTQIASVQGNGYATSQFFPRLVRGLAPLVSNVLTQEAMVLFLLALGTAISFGVQLCEFLSALVAPFALALSLGDLERIDPLKRWLSAFLALGMVKLSLNIIVALTAYTSLLSETDSDMLLFPLIFGIIGPLISGSLGYIGGTAVFASLTRLARGGVSAITGR